MNTDHKTKWAGSIDLGGLDIRNTQRVQAQKT